VCSPCDARISCKGSSSKPLGIPANKALRKTRFRVHQKLDPLWRRGVFSRGLAYKALAWCMEIPKKECHVAMFDPEMCAIAIGLLDSGEVEATCTRLIAASELAKP
jgi:hypothetical protein